MLKTVRKVKVLSRLAGGNPHGCNVGIFLGDEAVARAAALFAIWRNVMGRKLAKVEKVRKDMKKEA